MMMLRRMLLNQTQDVAVLLVRGTSKMVRLQQKCVFIVVCCFVHNRYLTGYCECENSSALGFSVRVR